MPTHVWGLHALRSRRTAPSESPTHVWGLHALRSRRTAPSESTVPLGQLITASPRVGSRRRPGKDRAGHGAALEGQETPRHHTPPPCWGGGLPGEQPRRPPHPLEPARG